MMYGTLRREFEELKKKSNPSRVLCMCCVCSDVSMRYLSVSTVRPSGFHFQLSTHTGVSHAEHDSRCRGTECSRAPRL